MSALVLQIVNTVHLTIYCCCTTPASTVHELLGKKNYPLYKTFPEEKEKPDLAADRQSSSEGSCHILKVPEVKQQLIILTSQIDSGLEASGPSVNIRGNSKKKEQSRTQQPEDYLA